MFATRCYFLIPQSLQSDCINLWFFKLRFLYPTEFIVWHFLFLRNLFKVQTLSKKNQKLINLLHNIQIMYIWISAEPTVRVVVCTTPPGTVGKASWCNYRLTRSDLRLQLHLVKYTITKAAISRALFTWRETWNKANHPFNQNLQVYLNRIRIRTRIRIRIRIWIRVWRCICQ